MESSNMVINDELCSKTHSKNTFLVQEKTIEVEDFIPETQQEQRKPSPSSNKKVPPHLWSKVHLLE